MPRLEAGDTMGGVALDGRAIVLVGGAGFIGHHLALRLASLGARVTVVDHLGVNNLRSPETWADQPNAALYRAMLLDRQRLLDDAGVRLLRVDARYGGPIGRALHDVAADTVVHLAAIAHADRTTARPAAAFEHGLRTLSAVLEQVRERRTRLVYFSSSMVYGHFDTATIDESHPLRPISMYGALKLCGEEMVKAYQRAYGVPYVIVRPSALYGPRCVSRRVVQAFVESSLGGRPMLVEGSGEERIDFTYVDDLVDGVALVLHRTDVVNETFNLTCGNARSLMELAETVRRAVPGARIEHRPRDASRPRRGTLSVDHARATLGYAPRVQIEDGVPRYLESIEELEQRTLVSARG